MAEDWSKQEVDLIVKDYFLMFSKEAEGVPYNKAEYNRNLRVKLNNRSRQSVDFKHRNISAVLEMLNQPYVFGYKPARNFQQLLVEAVINYWRRHIKQIQFEVRAIASTTPKGEVKTINFEKFEENAPSPKVNSKTKSKVEEPAFVYKKPIKTNYLELEEANTSIGNSGEELVMEFEKWRLIKAGKESLVKNIERVSEKSDGYGYDILSKNVDGTDRYIEVKTTKLTKRTPIYFSKGEHNFSKTHTVNYYLYRVFNLGRNPKLFIVNGAFDAFCSYEAVSYRGTFK